ncbi:hypothetical protein THRCLA_23271 [Thraustotheca clavata]|uniref:Ammonium transporter AmtB-like domain-containing protein n=1 Tax=Thraustotheca clavata TaxID=74557 RepID=A0A1V9Y879_9STRA|nr:hypothetical protein THRCLA_23271 [Thraustotheca clavata]
MDTANATIVVYINGHQSTYSWSTFNQALQSSGCSSNGLDILWMLFCTFQSMFILIGIASKSFQGMQMIAIAIIIALLSYAFTFALGFGQSGSFVGYDGFIFGGNFFHGNNTAIHLAFWLQQLLVTLFLATIILSNLERQLAPPSLILYTLFVVVIVHPPIVHTVWSVSGWLSNLNDQSLFGVGVLDMAGSSIIHLTAGASILIALLLVPQSKDDSFAWHQFTTITSMKGLFIWLGWYGLIQVSTVSVQGTCSSVSMISAVNMTLSAAASGVTISIIRWKWTFVDENAINHGILSGLVAISASAPVVHPISAIGIGIGSAITFVFMDGLLSSHDIIGPRDAIAIHLGNGVFGLISATLLASSSRLSEAAKCNQGLLYESNWNTTRSCGVWEQCDGHLGVKQWAANCIGALVILVWTTLSCFAFGRGMFYMGYMLPFAKDQPVSLLGDDDYSMISDGEFSIYHDFEDHEHGTIDDRSESHYLSRSLM